MKISALFLTLTAVVAFVQAEVTPDLSGVPVAGAVVDPVLKAVTGGLPLKKRQFQMLSDLPVVGGVVKGLKREITPDISGVPVAGAVVAPVLKAVTGGLPLKKRQFQMLSDLPVVGGVVKGLKREITPDISGVPVAGAVVAPVLKAVGGALPLKRELSKRGAKVNVDAKVDAVVKICADVLAKVSVDLKADILLKVKALLKANAKVKVNANVDLKARVAAVVDAAIKLDVLADLRVVVADAIEADIDVDGKVLLGQLEAIIKARVSALILHLDIDAFIKITGIANANVALTGLLNLKLGLDIDAHVDLVVKAILSVLADAVVTV